MEASALKLPSTFNWPKPVEYAAQATDALRVLGGFNSEFVKTNLVAPMQSTFNSLVIGVEQAIGTTINDIGKALNSGLAGLKAMIPPQVLAKLGDIAQVAGKIANFVGALVSGNVRVAFQEGVNLASSVISLVASCLGTVPVIGAMVQAALPILNIIGMLLPPSNKEVEAQRRAAQDRLQSRLTKNCADEARRWSEIASTSSTGPTPADHFRSVYIAAQLGRPLPPTVASMFVLLCGSESQGVGFTRNEYNSIIGSAQTVYGKQWRGISPEVQRRMWALCKSIMFSVEDPSLSKDITFVGDGGVTAFAMLQDIVRNQYRASNWDPKWLGLLSSYLGSRYTDWESVEGLGIGKSESYFDTCASSAVIDGVTVNKMRLDDSFLQVQRSWQNQLRDNFCDRTKQVPKGSKDQCVYRAVASQDQIDRSKRPSSAPGGVLVIDGDTAAKFGAVAQGTKKLAASAPPPPTSTHNLPMTTLSVEPLSLGAKLGIGAGVVAAGAGLWALTRER